MSVADDTIGQAVAEAEIVGPAERLIPWKPILLTMAVISVLMISVRIYQQVYGWTMGMDYFSADFQFYWTGIPQLALPGWR